jgi:type II secretory ATPase GspE/PulE/Tfp pilus assembly ATPase PilB-like protein
MAMSNGTLQARPTASSDEADQWLIDAARNAGHTLSKRERTRGTTAWRFLLNAGIADDEVLRLACVASGVEPADFTTLTSAMSALLPQGVALQHRVVPLGVRKNDLVVATSNPRNAVLERELAFAAKRRVQLEAGSPSDIIKAQAIVYGAGFGTPSSMRVIPPRPESPAASRASDARLPRLTLSMPAVVPAVAMAHGGPTAPNAAARAPLRTEPTPAESLADRLFATAMTDLASEVILDPASDGGLLVRMRIDGTLHDRFDIAANRAEALIASLKKGAGLEDGATAPSRGTANFRSPTGPLVVRVRTEHVQRTADASSLRERMHLRLCYSRGLVGITELGYSPAELHRLRALLGATGGLVIVAGPAGAGKTATLYAAARELCQWGRLVSTLEETIEYPLAGITQFRLPPGRRGLGAALRAAWGSTDDVVSSAVMADTTLDARTFEQCASAAGCGQLVMASLDAPDLISAFAGLRALHPDGGPVASALRGVVVQRLLRRLCTKCATPQVSSELPALERQLLEGLPTGNVRRPVGCEECRGTGYRGRMAIVELVTITPALHDAIARRAVAAELVHLVRKEGVSSLWESGIQHVLDGTTSLVEVLDAVAPPEPPEDFDALLSEGLAQPRRVSPPRRRAQ